MLAEAAAVEEVVVVSVEAVTQVLELDYQVSPEAHSQFGAVLVVSKQAVQDLLQLEEQVMQPSAQARQERASAVIP
jgi:alanine-alpha-ketoisovalerate/valine-pyruvate aminotransferase